MRIARPLAAALSLALLAACAQSPQLASSPEQGSAAQAWLGDVESIAAGADNAGRRLAITRRLDTLGLDWEAQAFESEHGPGENLLAEVAGPADAPLLLLGAHSDRVEVGQGATDNASGSATVLALAERFRERPLAHHRVAVAFWDQEERGLLGADAYVASGAEQPALYVNFDVFGWGDTVWMMAPDTDGPLVAATRTATEQAGLALQAGEQYPPTDHRAFLEAGWPAVSYSLVGGEEVALILQAYAGQHPDKPARLMEIIHDERDTVAEVDPDAAARAVDVIERALREWDAKVSS